MSGPSEQSLSDLNRRNLEYLERELGARDPYLVFLTYALIQALNRLCLQHAGNEEAL